MNRRGMLRGTAAALGGAGAALAGLRFASGESSAQTALSLTIGGDSATLGADESIAAVWLDCSVEWAYELPETAMPETVVVEIAAGTGDELVVVDVAETANLFRSADGSEGFETDLLESGALAASALEDGAVDVIVEARLRVENGDGEVLARETANDSATVSVDSESVDPADYGMVGGSGELRIETA